MRCIRISALGAAFLLMGLAAWWWITLPRTPEKFFLVRCSSCHKLPDLTKYKKDDIEGIVRTMRTKNGADKVIDDEEAEIITRYLEGTKQ